MPTPDETIEAVKSPQSPREAAIVKRINAMLSGEGSPVGKMNKKESAE